MNKIVAFGASNSRNSVNQQLAQWAATQMKNTVAEILDLNDFEMPIYSIDREKEEGFPPEAKFFRNTIKEADGIIISFAEHNGSYTAAFKNVFDWMSRIERPIWANKPMFLLSTSPGGRGAKNVLSHAMASFPHQGGQVAAIFSLPSFHKNFNNGSGITDSELRAEFSSQKTMFIQKIRATRELDVVENKG